MEPDPDSCLALAAIPLLSINPDLLLSVLFFSFLIIASAMISGSEMAFFSLSISEVDSLKDDRKESSRKLIALLNKPASLLATILICTTLINISIILVGEILLRQLLTIETCANWGTQLLLVFPGLQFTPLSFGIVVHFFITLISVTAILVLLGELIPKNYARHHTLSLARTMATPITILVRLFTPISRLMVRWSSGLEKRIAKHSESNHSHYELKNAIELTVKEGPEGRQEEVDILKRIIQFADVNTKQIMRPRTDIIAVEKEVLFSELMKIVRASGYSRIPVFEEDLDHIHGIIYVKDLIGHTHESDAFNWNQLVRAEVLYIPESKKINELLKEFQKERRHMAIVVDEYGGTAGLVTLEDIMEEIVGEIKDEFDDEVEMSYQQLDEHNYLFEGKAQINDVCRILGLEVNTFDDVKGDADSLAGLVLELAGVIPRKDTVVEFSGYTFRVTRVNKRRIEEIKLTRPS